MSRPSYYWKLFTYHFTIPLSLFAWRVSFGFWFRFTYDRKIARIEVPFDTDGEEVYEYKSLNKNAIRLLQLEPGAYDDPLRGRLFHADIDKAQQQYMALSYVWGRPDYNHMHLIRIDNGCLQVWDNLNTALRTLRSEHRTVTLWVDALCINQNDVVERGEQVQLMTKIYTGATGVYSWIGDATPASTVGMEILSYLLGDGPFDDGAPWYRRPASEVAEGLDDIIGRVYFQRIWIVQEAAVGRRVTLQVGHLSITWEAADTRRFLARIKLLEISPLWTAPASESPAVDFRALRELLEQSSTAGVRKTGRAVAPTLLDIVHTMRHMHSTDLRDKIFGMIGLAAPADVAGFVPDYTMSWEVTYKKFYEHAYAAALRNPDQTLEEHAKEGPNSPEVPSEVV
ncbi:heterokaryon incompatibility protein-domain-containing protein [Hypoxylon rubiginosum]|uniref:Heterokaryon incompatibility protein-domain-containing protein n=1 Tax=Hypoxylon rubiginosum TaxID=110542 RepID=A0ACC0D629_9PEZI|nr:heterokaryon incompatibility protein-domain-containing protein [Hypoxylon rubiginosum]